MLRCLILTAAVLATLWAGPATAQNGLPAAVRDALARAGVPPEALAAAALPLSHDAAPWRHRADVPMQPASTMKLVTSIVALDRLGPEHRGFTELRSAAPLSAGVLAGDLVLKGGADPDLGVPEFWALLLELRQAGVTKIDGDLVVDRTLFRPARLDAGLPPFDDEPEFPYNVIPDAVQLAGSLLPLAFTSDASGVRASTVPALPGIEITSRMTLNDLPCRQWSRQWKPAVVSSSDGVTRIELQGAFPRNCTRRAELQLVDRLELADRLFRTLWSGLGGTWSGRAREAAGPPDSRVLARREGRAWGEVLRSMNKDSDNAHTRMLFLSLGLAGMAADAQAPTTELAGHEVRAWLAQHRIADAGLVLDNGSGLSRSERITPLQLASMLKAAWRGRYASELQMSLPLAGVDGTMSNRLKDSPATGWARLKTGTLRNVVALAGYVTDPLGRPWAVAMMINHDDAAKARPALDALVDHIARVGLPAVAPGENFSNRFGP